MEDIFLTPHLKDYYMNDFNNLLTIEDGFWALDNGFLKEKLIKINSNSLVQTLYSKYGNQGPDDSVSYLEFAFCKTVEKKIFRSILPNILCKFNSIGMELSNCIYQYSVPRDNGNYRPGSERRGMACQDGENYFRINTMKISMESYDINAKNKFWGGYRFSII